MSKVPYSRYQDQIYLQGLKGERPALEVSYPRMRRQARRKLTPQAYAYVAGGAGSEETMRANRQAFRRWRIVPRMLRSVENRDHSVEILGMRFPAPLLLAPVGVQGIVHPQAEIATARAAAAAGLCTVLSTASSRTIEEVGQAAGEAPHWFQLYWPRHPELAASLLQRAERSGFSAVVVTLDTRFLGFRERDLRLAFNPFLIGQGIANYLSDPVFKSDLSRSGDEPEAAIRHFASLFSDPALTWRDLEWLRRQTSLPILLKGILHPDDARQALEAGMDGIIVSNHGGRQVDGSIASLEALPEVAEAVGGRCPVLFDSGIRRGPDILKALALGAQAVLVGRPFVWGLALNGEDGVREVLMRLLADFDLTMALSGCACARELRSTFLRPS